MIVAFNDPGVLYDPPPFVAADVDAAQDPNEAWDRWKAAVFEVETVCGNFVILTRPLRPATTADDSEVG